MENSGNQSSGAGVDPKVIAILAYVTFIGWIVALVLNSSKKSELATFHLRQSLGIILLALVSGFAFIVPLLGWLVGWAGYILTFVLWIIGLISAVNGEQKEVPVLGDKFQEWFKGL